MGKWFVEIAVDPALVDELGLLGATVEVVQIEPTWLTVPTDNRWSVSSTSWDSLASVPEVRAAAKEAVKELNRLLERDSALHTGLMVGPSTWEADASIEGGRRRHINMEVQTGVVVVSCMSASLTRNGIAIYPPRTRGLRERELRARDAEFDAACLLFENADSDLRKLWLPFEYARAAYEPQGVPGAPNAEVAAFCETANNRPHHRHKGKTVGHKYREVTGEEGRELVRRILATWLDDKNPT